MMEKRNTLCLIRLRKKESPCGLLDVVSYCGVVVIQQVILLEEGDKKEGLS